MTEKTEALLREALDLDESERADLAGALLESLEPPDDAAIDAAWREEVQRRLRALDSGSARLVPWDEVREELFSRLSDRS